MGCQLGPSSVGGACDSLDASPLTPDPRRHTAMSKLFADIRFGLTHMLVLGVLRPEEASKIKARLTRLERKWRKNKGKQP